MSAALAMPDVLPGVLAPVSALDALLEIHSDIAAALAPWNRQGIDPVALRHMENASARIALLVQAQRAGGVR